MKRGDTLYSIALEHGADYRDLAQWNSLDDPSRLSVGQVLRVTAPAQQAVQVGTGPAGSGKIESRPLGGAPGSKPAAEPQKPAPREEPRLLEAQPLQFAWPAKGKVLAGFAEPRRKGIDIDGKLGDPVIAAAAGRVTYVGSGIPGLGKLVVIRHDQGYLTVYAHNKDILVKEQQSVTRGQKIAELGASDAERPKLHFQIRKGAAAVDPLLYLPEVVVLPQLARQVRDRGGVERAAVVARDDVEIAQPDAEVARPLGAGELDQHHRCPGGLRRIELRSRLRASASSECFGSRPSANGRQASPATRASSSTSASRCQPWTLRKFATLPMASTRLFCRSMRPLPSKSTA